MGPGSVIGNIRRQHQSRPHCSFQRGDGGITMCHLAPEACTGEDYWEKMQARTLGL